jgi:endonuclease III
MVTKKFSMKSNLIYIIKNIKKAKLNAPVYKFQSLDYNKYNKFITTFLSSRTRDEVTYKASYNLISKADSLEKLRLLDVQTIENLIKPVAFYRVKAMNLKKISELDDIPTSLNELLKLPGVGVKIAKVFLAKLGMPYIGVDVHVHRILNRIGILQTRYVEETDKIINEIVPNEIKPDFNREIVALGQTICKAKSPKCEICPINKVCKKLL